MLKKYLTFVRVSFYKMKVNVTMGCIEFVWVMMDNYEWCVGGSVGGSGHGQL